MSGSLENTRITMFKQVDYDKQQGCFPPPFTITLKKAFDRIASEHQMNAVLMVRSAKNKESANEIKKTLPIFCFSGEFKEKRASVNLTKHSKLICLDFDKLPVESLADRKKKFSEYPFVAGVFVSPSGNGLKVVVSIADGSKHEAHYLSLLKDFPDADVSTKDVSRACFEGADKDIYINYNAVQYSKIIEIERVYITRAENKNSNTDFGKIEKWLEKKNSIYQSGNRNNFIFSLASACCRFGIAEDETATLITQNYLSKDSEFTTKEMLSGIRSAFKSNKFASAEFTSDILVSKETAKEIEIDLNADIADVIYGEDVYQDALRLFKFGYESAEKTGIPEIDRIFKWKRGELTVLTGIGNFGKSAWLNFMMVNKSIKDGSKWAVFSPENFPAQEFYHDLTEMIVGANCTPTHPNGEENRDKPREDIYEKAYRFASEHFFYIYPKEVSPTPEYIRSRFLELVIKEKVDGVVIDPFNQLTNDYSSGRDDRFLETFLSECSRFAVLNNVYYMIIAHPHKLQKDRDTKAYPVPDVFDLAGGAMWNNKADNILVYHRPNHHTDPMDRACELHSRKIRRQKIVGEKGVEQFEYHRKTRRFIFDEYPLKRLDLGYVSDAIERKLIPINHAINYSEPQKVEDETPF